MPKMIAIHSDLLFLWLLLPALFWGCASQPDSQEEASSPLENQAAYQVGFADISATAGLTRTNVSGGPDKDYIVETMSAGSAFLDYDNDGYLDLFMVEGTRFADPPQDPGNRLYRNIATPDNERAFREVGASAGLRHPGWGMGCAVADYDNDGDVDIYVTYWGPNRLFRNNGDGTFNEVGQEAGVADRGWGSSATFADLDADGALDLYATNYIEFDLENPPGDGEKCHYKGLRVYCGPQWIPRQPDRLYRNEGNGRFADKSAAVGISRVAYAGMGVIAGDFDNDGDADLYVANDGDPNLLYRNDGDWHFAEVGQWAGVAYTEDGRSQAGMGVHSGDYDNDGDLDLFVTNFADDVNTLYQNKGGLSFRDATFTVGLGGVVRPYLSWSTGFFDYDNDGWLDLFVVNGHLYPQLEQFDLVVGYAQPNLLFHNDKGHFNEVGTQSGASWDIAKVSRGASLGDYDNDGDVDLLIANINDTPTLLRNDGGNTSNWIGLELEGVQSNRDAIGAQVRVVAGDLEQIREVQRGYGFQAQHDPRLVFGLGVRDRLDSLEIRWPSGLVQTFASPPIRRYLAIREGEDEILAKAAVPASAAKTQSGRAPPTPSASDTALATFVAQPGWGADEYIQAGKTYYDKGHFRQAEAALKQALVLDPDAQQAYITLGLVYYSGTGEQKKAADLLEKAVKQDSTWLKPHYWLGRVFLSVNDLPQALASFKKAADLGPSSAEIHLWLGLTYVRLDSLEKAKLAFTQASKNAPWDSRPYLQLAQIHKSKGDLKAATQQNKLFNKAAALEQRVKRYQLQAETYTDQARAHSNLGMAYTEQGRMTEALAAFQKAIDLDKEYGRAFYGLGKVYYRQKKLEQAIKAYELASKLEPQQAEIVNDLGQAYFRAKRYADAVEAYQRAAELRPQAGLIYNNLGLAYTAQENFEAAIKAYKTGLEHNPAMTKMRLSLARLYARLGKRQEAEQQFKSLMRPAPGQPSTRPEGPTKQKRPKDQSR